MTASTFRDIVKYSSWNMGLPTMVQRLRLSSASPESTMASGEHLKGWKVGPKFSKAIWPAVSHCAGVLARATVPLKSKGGQSGGIVGGGVLVN